MRQEPTVSMLVITEKRPEFMEWVAFLFNRLDWSRKELIVVGSTEDQESISLLRRHVNTKKAALMTDTTLPPGRTLGEKRNRALEMSSGEWITWADDDDWYPANRFQTTWDMFRMYKWPKGIKMLAVQTPQPVVCLENMRAMSRVKRWCWLHCWYNGEAARATPFLEVNVGEDGFWIDKFLETIGGEDADPPVFIQNYIPGQLVCLQHGRNISCGNHSTDPQFWPDDLPPFLGEEDIEQMEALKQRLGIGA